MSGWIQAAMQQTTNENNFHLPFFKFQATEARAEQFDELIVENTALKARVQLLEEGKTSDLTLLVGQKMDEGASSEEVKELKNQLKAAEIRKQRLIEAFKKTSSDFREVSYRLTGNSFDFLFN